ncbi:sigma-54 dependent transcriptional regulator [Thermodesulfovibrionales bacterium]|nr:sigma-54 dependent transcriptional regulator [Thermodesulfovibrionales bacterium]
MQKILIVEDKEAMVDMLTRTFQADGFAVRPAYTVSDGVAALLQGGFDAVITDMRLPDGDGMEILKAVKRSFPLVPVVVITAFGSIKKAVEAVKGGAYDFITKPFDPEHLLLIIKRALEEKSIERENLVLKKEFSKFLEMPEIIGVSNKWNEIIKKVKRVATTKTTVLILGESGTGKEVIARAIHYMGPRASKSFVAINCAAISKDLIESELFGHEKGAFTGATEIKHGRFELADRGTVFLDEIGDMAMPLQSKLLRVLEESEFERVGGTKTIKVDLKIVAASNKDLKKEVSEGRFREDLLYRLDVFPIAIPPLRERRQDIIPLVRYFIPVLAREIGKNISSSVSPEVERILLAHEWRGNTRELRNAIERAVILCDGTTLLPEHFSFHRDGPYKKINLDAPLHEVAAKAAKAAERVRIEDALKQASGNKTKTAEMLKVSYKTLLSKIKEYGIGIGIGNGVRS